MTTRKDGFTPPRTDLPTVGMVIVAFEDQIIPRYCGPFTVVAVDPERPRIKLLDAGIAEDGCWSETFVVHDGGLPPSGGPPYSVLQWNLVTDLNARDRRQWDKRLAWLAEQEPKARHLRAEWDARVAADREARAAARQAAQV